MKTAILYQSQPAPAVGGIVKPMKSGGYRDSGADIAFALYQAKAEIVLPSANPQQDNELDWVFPDTVTGIDQARKLAAECLWLNTVTYPGHPIEAAIRDGIRCIGQLPEDMGRYDDKFFTNQLVEKKYPGYTATQIIVDLNSNFDALDYPAVVKPIRGRGSQGVMMVSCAFECQKIVSEMLISGRYGERFIFEPYLTGREFTVAVLPPSPNDPGTWRALPVVERVNHQRGIAPYNGVVAVMANSFATTPSVELDELRERCQRVAAMLNLRGLTRIDARQDSNGQIRIFDINMKPNMTAAGRRGREDQDSLIMIAARAYGWSFVTLLEQLLQCAWRNSDFD